MKNQIKIRPLGKSDIPKLQSLIKKHLDLKEKWVYKGEPWYYWTLSNLFSETCLVAENGKGIVGFVAAYKDQHTNKEIFIEDLLVDHEVRRVGLGTKLISELIKRAKVIRCDSIWGTIDPKNKVSLSFFKSFGFENRTKAFSSKFVFNGSVKIKEIESELSFMNLKGSGKHRCIYQKILN